MGDQRDRSLQGHGPPSGTVTIPRRFVGPPDSANGGYACGITARLLGGGPAVFSPRVVTLHRPPPVERPLRIERDEERVALYDGEELVSEARPAPKEPSLGVGPDPPPGSTQETAGDAVAPHRVSFDNALRAAERFDVAGYAARHPFPTCFTCGPGRASGDGLRIFPAPAGDDASMVVSPWTPDASVADSGGLVDLPVVWAALDCPSGFPRFGAIDVTAADAVLGRMTTSVRRRPEIDEKLVVAAWAIADEGRKLLAGSALWAAAGELLAHNLAVWIVLTEEQRRAFKTSGAPS
jgi:hypothetical protein